MVHVVRNTLSRHIVNIGTAAPLGQYLAKKQQHVHTNFLRKNMLENCRHSHRHHFLNSILILTIFVNI